MNRKNIQKERMRKYFTDAAKQIIETEGITGVTARKVGDISGYSYATLYNYFKDLKELLAYCAYDYLNDCYSYMMKLCSDGSNYRKQILDCAKAYFDYFADRTCLFHLIFIEDLGNYPVEISKDNNAPAIGSVLLKQLENCAGIGCIKQEYISIIHRMIISSIHGKLLFYIYGRHSAVRDEIIKSLEEEIRLIIGETKESDDEVINKNSTYFISI